MTFLKPEGEREEQTKLALNFIILLGGAIVLIFGTLFMCLKLKKTKESP